jgi:DNA-binding transcriptional LysR family regulator
MTLQQLRYFLEACRHGSFAAAADALYLAQPSVSDQVRRLEGELGVKLFVRSGRRLTLTDAGLTLRPHAEAVLASVERAAASVSDVRELRGGTASFGTFSIAYHFILRPIISDFAARYPDVSLRVVGQNSLEVADQIRAGELEAGLIVLPVDTTGFVVEQVMDDEIFFAYTGDAVAGDGVTVEMLAATRLIFYDAHYGWRSPTRRQLAERAHEAGVELAAAIEVETLEAAVQLAAHGLGGTIVPRTVRDSAGFPEILQTAPFVPPVFDTLAFVWREGAKLSPATTVLVQLAREHIQKFARARSNAVSASS